MKKYRITLDSSYLFQEQVIEAENILHLLSLICNAYNLDRITKIELID